MAQARDATAGTTTGTTAGREPAARGACPSPGAVRVAGAIAVLVVLAATLDAFDDLATRWAREDRVLMIRQSALADLDAIDAAAGAQRPDTQRPAVARHAPPVVRRDLAETLRVRGDELARRGRRALRVLATVVALAGLFAAAAPWAWGARRRRREIRLLRPAGLPATGNATRADTREVVEATAPAAPAAMRPPCGRPRVHALPPRPDPAPVGLGQTAAATRAAGDRMRSLLDRIGSAATLGSTAADTGPAAGKP